MNDIAPEVELLGEDLGEGKEEKTVIFWLLLLSNTDELSEDNKEMTVVSLLISLSGRGDSISPGSVN